MSSFLMSDFQVSTTTQKNSLRKKLKSLAESLVDYAKQEVDLPWDYYVTNKTAYGAQWGAICPMPVKGYESNLSLCPNIFFDIPQNGKGVWVAANAEFLNPREMLKYACSSSRRADFLSVLKNARGATLTVLKKQVHREDKRIYEWNELWNPVELPEIEVSNCTEQFLDNFLKSTAQLPAHQNVDYIWEPVFLVRYEFSPQEIVQSNDVVGLLGEKVRNLAPIIRFWVQNK